jgi:zinc protease
VHKIRYQRIFADSYPRLFIDIMRLLSLRLRLFLLACGFLPLWSQAAPPIAHWQTPQGARVYFVASDALPILDVQVQFPAGSAQDPPGKSGLSALTFSLLETGAGALDEEQIADAWADEGAQFSASTDPDRGGVRLRTLAAQPQRGRSLALLQTLLSKPNFPTVALQREKNRIIEEIKEADTRPDALASKAFFAALYPGHPYGVHPDVQSVSGLEREDVFGFYRRTVWASQAVISIVGQLSRQEAQEIAQGIAAALPSSSEAPARALPEVVWPAARVQKIAHHAQQSHILMGLPTIARGDADYFPLLVGNYVLGGGGFVSRLMKEVREKRGYAYSVYSYLNPLKQPGVFQIGLQTRREQAQEALATTNAVLSAFIADGPSAQELSAAQDNLANSLALRIDSNAKLLDYLSLIGFYELPLTYLDEFAHKVRAVTRQQIREAFGRHIRPEHLITVIVAPPP